MQAKHRYVYCKALYMLQPSCLLRQKYIGKCKDAVKMSITYKQKCDQSIQYVNCDSWNAHCSIYKVEIISLEFKWLIVLRSALKACDQIH